MASSVATSHPLNRLALGFTLLELILVLILVGILGVTVIPRLTANNSDDASIRDQLISRLQLVQSQSMNSRSYSYRLVFSSSSDPNYSGYYQTQRCDSDGSSCSCHPGLDVSGSCSSDVFYSGSSIVAGWLRFDAWGRPLSCPDGLGSSTLPSSGQCSLVIGDYSVLVESEGYIYAP